MTDRAETNGAMRTSIGWKVLATALLGLGLATLLLLATGKFCESGNGIVCEMVTKNPPWLLVSGVAAAPSILLTWFWRTDHKERDLAHASSAHALTQLEQITQRFATAVEMINKQGMSAVGGIYALDRVARDSPSDHWAVIETICACLRDLPDGPYRRAIVQAGVTVIGRRDVRNDPPGARIRLYGADLRGADFSKLNFANADLADAYVDNARFLGTDLRGATLSIVPIKNPDDNCAVYDEETKFEDGETEDTNSIQLSLAVFRANGARQLDELIAKHARETLERARKKDENGT